MVILNSASDVDGSSTISSEHFGLNYLIHIDAGDDVTPVFANIANGLHGTGSVRFPGGTVAEIGAGGVDPLDISVNNGAPADTTIAFLESAEKNDWSVTFVLPMWRFVNEDTMVVDDVPAAVLAIRRYVAAVIADADELGVTIDGFELGNEWDLLNYRALDDDEELRPLADAFSTAYAGLSAELAVAIHEEINDANLATDPFIAIQSLWAWMGNEGDLPTDYRNALEVAFPDSSDPDAAQNVVDAVIAHFYLGHSGAGAEVNDPSTTFHLRNMADVNAIFGDDLDYLISEWNLRGNVHVSDEVGNVTPHWSENSADGIQQLEPIVGIFHTMISEGVDYANFWAVRQSSWNSLYGTEIENDMPVHDRPVRYIFDLLSDQLMGTTAVDLSGDTSGSMTTIGDHIHVYGFEGANSTVLYLGSRSATAQSINLDLGNYGTSSENPLVQITHISVDNPNQASHLQETTIVTQEYTFNQFQALAGDFLEFSPYELISIEIINNIGSGETESGTDIQDAMFGTAANDIFMGSVGADEIYGYFGTDTADYSDSGAGVNVYLNTYFGTNSGAYAVGDTLQSIENVTGSSYNDTLSGDTEANILIGRAGDDELLGRYGNDRIYGGAGNDTIYGGYGNDIIYGGTGNDVLRGDAGDDNMAGGIGADTVIGGAGNDVLSGSSYGDELHGGDGIDFINGGFGHDRLNGGTGADKFYHIGIAGHGTDWIQDYVAADGDVLMWGGGAATTDDFLIQRAETANAGVAGVEEIFVTHIPSGNLLWALVDGDAQTQINIQISGQVFDLLG